MATGYYFGKLNKLTLRDQRTLAIETDIHNSGLALAPIFNPRIFPPEMELGGMAIIAAWWGIWHIISGLTIAFFLVKKTYNCLIFGKLVAWIQVDLVFWTLCALYFK